ncbi:MAG: hypothetical protein JSR44_03870 [Spirochaetes bacterium]|nr:hypothetical protein [Spirochaetota bacterium]
MNRNYKENILALLAVIESGRALNFLQIAASLAQPVSERTVQRYLSELKRDFALDLGTKRGVVSEPTEGYLQGLSRFLKAYFGERINPPIFGVVDEKKIAAGLKNHRTPARTIREIIKAICETRRLSFLYKPQHPETRKKHREALMARAHKNSPPEFYSVSMIPRGISFGGELMLVVGEAFMPNLSRERRQYALRGIVNPQCGTVESCQLTFRFSEVYKDSIYTWLGGARYSLQIEDSRFDEVPHVYTLNANGEEEALQFAASALGRVKIINPPRPLIEKAKELHLDQRQLFRFSA